MFRHGFEWEQKGTHEEHLSVIDYKKQERTKELAAVEEKLTDMLPFPSGLRKKMLLNNRNMKMKYQRTNAMLQSLIQAENT